MWSNMSAQNAPYGRGENVAPRGVMGRSGCVAGRRLDLAIPQQGLRRSRCIIVRCVVVDPRAVWCFSGAACPTQPARRCGNSRRSRAESRRGAARHVVANSILWVSERPILGIVFLGGRVGRSSPRTPHGATWSNIFAASVRRILRESVAPRWFMGLLWDSS